MKEREELTAGREDETWQQHFGKLKVDGNLISDLECWDLFNSKSTEKRVN